MVELTVEVGHNISRNDSEARKDILLLAKADQVIWPLQGCGGDVIVIGGRLRVITLN